MRSTLWSASNASMRLLVVKLLFRLRHPLLLQLSIELAASLNVRLLFALNELLSVLASFRQTPNALFAQRGIREAPENPKGERFLTRLSKKWDPKCELGISSHLDGKTTIACPIYILNSLSF